MRFCLVLFVSLALLAMTGVAEARHVHFAGPHPIAAKYGGGYCYIETPHLHIYPPDHPALYQEVGDEYVFTGDPTPFGYDGEKFPYYGHHPVASVGAEPLYCYIDGPHFHTAPPPSDGYQVKSGVAFYVGPFAPAYQALKGHRAKLMNAEYRPFAQFRPTVTVQPPPEWHGEIFVPGVVGAPGVVVGAPGIVVGAPPPLPVVVAPPGVVVAPHGPPHPIIAEHHHLAPPPREHHDNGKHKGWFK